MAFCGITSVTGLRSIHPFGFRSIRLAHFLAGKQLKSRSGDIQGEKLEDKPLVLYFSAGWCHTCKGFTPKIKKFAEKVQDEVNFLWVSRDKSAADLAAYYEKTLPAWPYLPFGSPITREFLKKYSLKAIPAVLVVNNKGDVIDDGAKMRIEREEDPSTLIAEWKKAL